VTDLQRTLEKLEIGAAECELIARLACEPEKREMYEALAQQYRTMAAEVNQTIARMRQFA